MSSTRVQAPRFQVGARRIAPGEPCFIIGEVGLAHDGSLGVAHAFIDAVAKAGADAVKFQTHLAEAESTPVEPFRVRGSRQDATRYEYWKRTAFTEGQWRELVAHAASRGLCFLSSPFSVEAVDLLARVGVPAWKIASGQVSDRPMFERIASTGLPVLLSTGMSPLSEIDAAVAAVTSRGLPLLVFQTTSLYPTPPERVGLNLIPLFRERYRCPVGLSDHSGTIWPGVAAAAGGIDMLEVHVTFSREMFGFDVSASLTTGELALLVQGVRFIEAMRVAAVDKDRMAEELRSMRAIFSKSVVVRTDLQAGSILQERHLIAKKPGTGIPPERMPELIGRRVRRAVKSDALLCEEDLE